MTVVDPNVVLCCSAQRPWYLVSSQVNLHREYYEELLAQVLFETRIPLLLLLLMGIYYMSICSEIIYCLSICSEIIYCMSICSEIIYCMSICSEIIYCMSICSEIYLFNLLHV